MTDTPETLEHVEPAVFRWGAISRDQAWPMIHAALVDIIGELPALAKDQQNTQQNFKFRGIDAILDALKSLLARHGVHYVPRTLERLEATRKTASGGTLWVVHLHVEFTFYAVDGSSVVATAWGEGTDVADKATPKAHTGAQKNALLEVFSIATNESDPDRGGETAGEYIAPPEGWESIEDHDKWRHDMRERNGRLPLDAQGKFAAWWREQHWRWPLTGEQADAYAEALSAIEAEVAALEAPFEENLENPRKES